MRFLDNSFDMVGAYGDKLLYRNDPFADPVLWVYAMYDYLFKPSGQ